MAAASLVDCTAEECRNYIVPVAEARHSCIEVAAGDNWGHIAAGLDLRLEHLEACLVAQH